jgi:hypothetical protein
MPAIPLFNLVQEVTVEVADVFPYVPYLGMLALVGILIPLARTVPRRRSKVRDVEKHHNRAVRAFLMVSFRSDTEKDGSE